MLGLYLLDPEIGNGQLPIPCDDFLVWAEWMATGGRRVASDMVGTFWLSTIFTGLDTRPCDGPPIVFETMAFDESDDTTVAWLGERYSTWEDALWGHKEWLEKLKASVETGESG